MFGSILAAAVPSLIGGAFSALGAKGQLDQGEAMSRQYQYNQNAFRNQLLEGPSLEMQGLKKAGINPLLRYGQYGSPTSAVQQGVSHAPPTNPLQGFADALGGAGTSAAGILSTLESTKKTTAEIDKIGQEILNLATQQDLTREQVNHEQVKIQNTFADTVYKWTLNELGQAEAEKIAAQIRNLDANTLVSALQAQMLEKGVLLSDIAVGLIRDFTAGYGPVSTLIQRLGNAPQSAVETNNWISGKIRDLMGMEPY